MYQNDTSVKNTGERIARQNNISRISVLRAEGYAKAVDLADVLGFEIVWRKRGDR